MKCVFTLEIKLKCRKNDDDDEGKKSAAFKLNIIFIESNVFPLPRHFVSECSLFFFASKMSLFVLSLAFPKFPKRFRLSFALSSSCTCSECDALKFCFVAFVRNELSAIESESKRARFGGFKLKCVKTAFQCEYVHLVGCRSDRERE